MELTYFNSNGFYYSESHMYLICIYVTNSRFEQRVDKNKGAEKSMANCDKTKSEYVILLSKTLIQI